MSTQQIRSFSHWRRIMGGSYIEKLLASGPIAYWPQNELVGSAAYCQVNSAQDGTYTGVTLADQSGPFGTPSPFYDGTNDFTNIYTATLNGAFDGDTGSLLLWARVYNAGVWTDSTGRTILYLRVDADNYVEISKPVNSQILLRRMGSTTPQYVQIDPISETGWMALGMSWDTTADELKAFYNGAQTGSTQSGLHAFSGSLASTRTVVGANSTTPSSVWHGWIGHPILWDRVVTPAEFADFAAT